MRLTAFTPLPPRTRTRTSAGSATYCADRVVRLSVDSLSSLHFAPLPESTMTQDICKVQLIFPARARWHVLVNVSLSPTTTCSPPAGCYLRDGDRVFETYWSTGRGAEVTTPGLRTVTSSAQRTARRSVVSGELSKPRHAELDFERTRTASVGSCDTQPSEPTPRRRAG